MAISLIVHTTSHHRPRSSNQAQDSTKIQTLVAFNCSTVTAASSLVWSNSCKKTPKRCKPSIHYLIKMSGNSIESPPTCPTYCRLTTNSATSLPKTESTSSRTVKLKIILIRRKSGQPRSRAPLILLYIIITLYICADVFLIPAMQALREKSLQDISHRDYSPI